MQNATIAQARGAKIKITDAARAVSGVVAIGIAKIDGSYAVKVNLQSKPLPHHLPDEVDGVPVVYEVIGAISAR